MEIKINENYEPASLSGENNFISSVVRLGGCYEAIVLADNATFVLAVNRIAAFRVHSAIIPNVITRSRGSVGRATG